ncbi:MBL fold metallo-hydrolase [Gimesia panareensis]|uniref:MBL fold metallo-hydrolase n=1 Tax=Gimesia panareensis TaxID=2527978 RepID=UPI00118C57AA|nr:MBL fold metallo-hydrolase [Gimesia panareensis]QDU48095.1 Hydroxyacylglutathione hydrolase [Gimesia panareensis]
MISRWLRFLLWQPYALLCRRFPLWPFQVKITRPVEYVTCIQIDNLLTRLLSRFSGGYDYAVCYLVDETLLIDTGFPWARRSLKKTLQELGVVESITTVVNTHYHEDHTGNNDLLVELCGAEVLAHADAVPEIRFPVELRWYRSFLFGPSEIADAHPIGDSIKTEHMRFEVIETPGHCPGHLCLFEPERKILFSGDLYIAADLDSQLGDADGPKWIASLEQVIQLQPEWLFDAHGTVLEGSEAVEQHLRRKLEFLQTIRARVYQFATHAQSIEALTRKVFDRQSLVDFLSFGEGWLSLITGSDFSRSNIVKSFLREKFHTETPETLSTELEKEAGEAAVSAAEAQQP